MSGFALSLVAWSNGATSQPRPTRPIAVLTSAAIPSQPLPAALDDLSRQTGLQIIFFSEVADGRQSSPAPAGVPATDALWNILRSTGLTFEFIDDSTVDLKPLEAYKALRHEDPPPPKSISKVESATLDEVMVTAQKRAESLQDVPLSIVAVPGATLENFRVETLAELAPLVPNLVVSNVVGTESIYLRGVGGGGRNVGFDTRTGIYIDGVYTGNAPAANAVLLDVDRVEVLRGPQGFLFGQSSDSGAISIVTRPPDDSFHSKVAAAYGNDHIIDVAANTNLPLTDSLFMKLSVSDDKSQGFTRNTLTGAYVDGVDDQAGRVQIRAKLDDGLTLDLASDFARQENRSVVGEARTNAFGTEPSGLQPFQVDNNTPELNFFRNYGVSGTVTYTARGVDLTSITAYRRSYRHWMDDLDHSALDIADIDYVDDYSTVSQELRAASTAPGPWRYTAGLYVTNGCQSSVRRVNILSDGFLVDTAPGGHIASLPTVRSQSYSLFGSVDIDLLPRLTLDIGLRVSDDRKKLDASQRGDAGVLGLLPFVEAHESTNEAAFTPTIGINYRPETSILVYLKYSRGAKAGGFNADFSSEVAPGALPFKQETANSYETGMKSEWFEHRLRTNLALFLTDFSNYQLYHFYQLPDGLLQGALQNAGAARTYGPEFEIDAEPLPHLVYTLSGAWLSAKYQSFPNGGGVGVDYSGHRMEFAPKWSLSSILEYSRVLPGSENATGFTRIHMYYRDRQYTTPADAAPFEIASYAVADAQLGVSRGAWTLNLFSNNLLDHRYDTSKTTDAFGTLIGFRGTPRTYGIQMTFKTQ